MSVNFATGISSAAGSAHALAARKSAATGRKLVAQTGLLYRGLVIRRRFPSQRPADCQAGERTAGCQPALHKSGKGSVAPDIVVGARWPPLACAREDLFGILKSVIAFTSNWNIRQHDN
jgi:hypothetical protein